MSTFWVPVQKWGYLKQLGDWDIVGTVL